MFYFNFADIASNNNICRSNLHDLVIYLIFRYSVILIFDSLIK